MMKLKTHTRSIIVSSLALLMLLSMIFIGNTILDVYAGAIDDTPYYGLPPGLESFVLPGGLSFHSVARNGDDGALIITDPELLSEIVSLNNFTPPEGATRLTEIAFIPFGYNIQYHDISIPLSEGMIVIQGFPTVAGDEEMGERQGMIQPTSILWEVRNVRPRPPRTAIFTNSMRHVTLHNSSPIYVHLSDTATVASTQTMTANVGISVSAVSAGVGFTIGQSISEQSTASANVPPFSSIFFDFALYAQVYDFNIYQWSVLHAQTGDFWARVGHGDAARAAGVWRRTWM